jgi:hypothetical protein
MERQTPRYPRSDGRQREGVSTFNFVLDGKEVYGNYHHLDLEEAKASGRFNASELKMIEWNNRVVSLVEDFFTLVQSAQQNQLGPAVNPQNSIISDPRPVI